MAKFAIFEVEEWEGARPSRISRAAHDVVFPRGKTLEPGRRSARRRSPRCFRPFIYSEADPAEALEPFEKLRLIATRRLSTGFDFHIDLDYFCAEKGIEVANVRTYGENTVAEYTSSRCSARISHRIVEAPTGTRRGRFLP